MATQAMTGGLQRNDADYYDYYALGNPGDVDFYVAKAKASGGVTLEIGCGTGRVTIPIARAGVEIVGLDIAQGMLDEADRKLAAEPAEVKARVRWVQGDMRTFSLGRRFGLVIIPYRSFQYMMTPQQQIECLQVISRHLDHGGLLVFDIFDPDIGYVAAHQGALGAAQKLHARFMYPPTGTEVLVWESSEYDQELQVLTQIRTFEELSPAHMGVSRLHSGLEMRYTFRFEMEHALRRAGFEVVVLHSDFEEAQFTPGKDQVWVARKPAKET